MGATNRDRTEIIKGLDSLLPYFQGRASGPLMGGAELELFMMARAGEGFRRISDYENFRLFAQINTIDPGSLEPVTPISQEPEASQIETLSRPHTLSDIHFVSQEIAGHRATILRRAGELEIDMTEIEERRRLLQTGQSLLRPPELPLYRGDLLACPFATLPYGARGEALVNIISPRGSGADYSDRPRVMSEAFSRAMTREAAQYPVSNVAVHFTHGVKDLRHAFEMTRLHAALLPFFFVLTENRPPYADGSDKRILYHTGLRAHASLNVNRKPERGLLPAFLFEAQDEHDFLKRMIDRALSTPMLAYYDHDGKFTAAPSDKKITPLSMQGLGPENVAQFELALSTFWWSFKYKLPHGPGILHELRDFDSGPEVVANVSLIAGMLALNDAARADMINRLDRKYGIPLLADPEKARHIIRSNLFGVYYRGNTRIHPDSAGRHMLVPFGCRGHTMLDFLRADLLPMLERQYRGTPAAALLDNLRFVAQNGMTNAQLWYDAFGNAQAQQDGVRAMTADRQAYNSLYSQSKSWAQHHDEGKLPDLRLRPRP